MSLFAAILVGGEGTRLRPLTETVPKPMLPVLGRPLLAYTFDQLRAAGVTDAALACGYLPTQIEAHFGSNADGIRLTYCVEPEPLGTGGAIRFAAAGVDATFLALNGDSLRDVDVRELVDFHRRRGARATLLLTEVPEPSRYGLVRLAKDGRVREFLEKPRPDEIDTRLVNAGVYVLEPSVLDLIAPGRPVSVERDVFPVLAARGELYALALPGYWLDVGTPESYLQAHLDLISRRSGEISEGASVSATAEVRHPVMLASGVSVGDGARVGPLVYAGEGVRIGANAVVERAVVMRGARVAAGSRVTESIVASDGVVGA